MLNRLNSIWKNLLLDFLGGLLLGGLMVLNLFGKSNDFLLYAKIAFVLIIFLFLHGLFLLFLFVKNIIDTKYLKAIGFLLITSVLYMGLWLSYISLLLSSGGSPYTDQYELHNFKKSETCKQFDKNEIKKTIENLDKKIYSADLNAEFIEQVKADSNLLPKKIIKIECGCKLTDSTIIVFRIWDIKKNTFELEFSKDNGKWKYERLYYSYFDE